MGKIQFFTFPYMGPAIYLESLVPKSPVKMKKPKGTEWWLDIVIILLHLIIWIEQIWQPEQIMQD